MLGSSMAVASWWGIHQPFEVGDDGGGCHCGNDQSKVVLVSFCQICMGALLASGSFGLWVVTGV